MNSLGHLRILDLTRVLAGPWCTQWLADLGADVIKIERPGTGDDTRSWGPPWLDLEDGPRAAYFQCANRNKRSVAIDLSKEEGRDLVRKIAATSDVVIDNFRRGTMEKWGLDRTSLGNPRLVTCSIAGFSKDGAWADRPGYDLLIQGMGGVMSITGDPDGPPTKTGVAVADLMTGMYASTAILAALSHRDRTGEGQHIDLSLFDTQLAWLANQGQNALATGKAPTRKGNAHPNIVPYQTFQATDGWFNVAVGTDAQFAALAGMLGRVDWVVQHPTNADRVKHRDVLIAELSELFAMQSREHWLEVLSAADIPCAPVLDVVEALNHPAANAVHVQADGTRTLANPVQFEKTPVRYDRPPPALGQHTDEVLLTVGITSEQLAELRSGRVIP